MTFEGENWMKSENNRSLVNRAFHLVFCSLGNFQSHITDGDPKFQVAGSNQYSVHTHKTQWMNTIGFDKKLLHLSYDNVQVQFYFHIKTTQ